MSRKDLCRRGALEGLIAWMIYWAAESFLMHILPRLSEPATSYMPPPASFTAVLLAIYMAVGAALGALVGLALPLLPAARGAEEDDAARLRAAATLTVGVVAGGNLASRLPPGLPGWFLCSFFFPVAIVLLATLIAP